jgi:hypothetical protein
MSTKVPKFQKRYFLAPTRNNPPGGLIKIGNLIREPDLPDEPINSQVDFGSSQFSHHTETGWEFSAANSSDNSGGIWASFLEQVIGASGSAGAAEARGSSVKWTADSVITVDFGPRNDYLKSLLADAEVLEYLVDKKSWMYDTKLYLITGVKVAFGASMVNDFAKKWGVNMQAAVDITPTGVPGQLGGGLQSQHDGQAIESVKKLEPFILGYRLRRLKVNSKLKITENISHDRGAMFGKDGELPKALDPSALEFSIEALEPEDVDVTDPEWVKREVEDFDGETVLLNIPEL